MIVLAIALGLLVGLSLGALGGGGSTLAVPILVFVASLSAQDATTASLVVVGVASGFGAWQHSRRGNVHLRAGLAFGAAGIVGSRLGTTLNRSLDERFLLLAFAGLITLVAVRMYRSAAQQGRRAPAPRTVEQAPSSTTEVSTLGGTTALATLAEPMATPDHSFTPAHLVKLGIAATIVGTLTGLFGIGGGFAVVPALTLLLGYGAKEAIGTSLVVIVVNTTIALTFRADHLDLDWAIVGPFLVTVTIGVLAGSQIAHRLDAKRLTKSFALMLVAVAVYTAASTLFA